MKCQWKWCCEEGTRIVFRPVERTAFGRQRPKHRVWNEDLCVCDACLPAAQTEYPYRSFVRPKDYDANFNLGCWR